MRNLAKVENTPVVKAVSNPSPEAGPRLGRVHATDGRVLPAALDLNAFKN